jgi:transcriptional regulator GlxA family with amidase domain
MKNKTFLFCIHGYKSCPEQIKIMEGHPPADIPKTNFVGGPDRRVLHLRKLFVADLSHDWSLDEMAERVNISASHLGRLFRSETGISPKEYLRQLRLEHASRLLRESFLSVKEIRLATGYSDKTMFIKAFKAKYGAAPNEYRKSSHDESEQVGKAQNKHS